MANSWFRMYAEFCTDPKVQMMSEAMQRRLVMVMCMRCGDVTVTLDVTERDAAMAFALRLSDADLTETKALFVRKGFIDEGWELLNWDKRQFASDSSAERTRAYRDRKKQAPPSHGDGVQRHCDALDTDTDTEQSRRLRQADRPLEPTTPEARAPIPATAEPEQKPTFAALACKALIGMGIRCQPSHPELVKLIQGGVSLAEITEAGMDAKEADKLNIGWVIGAIYGRRKDAAKRGTLPSARAGPGFKSSHITDDFSEVKYGSNLPGNEP